MTYKVGQLVDVQLTTTGAIYVDNTRITNRNTKWGVHHNVFSSSIPIECIVETLTRLGFADHVKNIDKNYLSAMISEE
jgi:hypothetical protein